PGTAGRGRPPRAQVGPGLLHLGAVMATTSYETLLAEIEDGVATLAVNRPEKRNALNATVRRELIEALDSLRARQDVRVLILTGTGEKAFVAGADVAEFAQRTPHEQRAVMAGRSAFEEV